MEKILEKFEGKYAPFSNFYPSPLDCFGMYGKTAEHVYQAYKMQIFDDAVAILSAETPGQAKRLGRKKMLRIDWSNEMAMDAMRRILHAKFIQNPELGELLLSTGNAELVEGNNWHDNRWGACECIVCFTKPKENQLGKLLMELRSILKEKEQWEKRQASRGQTALGIPGSAAPK